MLFNRLSQQSAAGKPGKPRGNQGRLGVALILITFVYLALAVPTPALATTATTFKLPDARAWELVSPPDKDGSAIYSMEPEYGVIQAAENGDGIAYVAAGPIPGEGQPAG